MEPFDTPIIERTLFVAGLAFLIALLVTPIVRRLALAIGAVDTPGDRHIHARVTPSLGGLAIAAAAIFATLSPSPVDGPTIDIVAARGWSFGWLAIGTLIILVTGAIDDLRGLQPWTKLTLQTLAGATAIVGGYAFRYITNPIGDGVLDLGWLGALASLIWIVGTTNAFNLIDGLDGLATGVGVIACATICVVAIAEGRPDALLLSVALGAALLGFLVHNFHPASIFLGDSGSMLIGYWLAILSTRGLQKGTTTIIVLVPVFTLGLPIIETSLSIVRRYLVAGWAAVIKGDQEHIHHKLLSLGLNHRNAVLTIYAAAGVLGGAALIAVYAKGPMNALLVASIGAGMLVALRKLGYGRIQVPDEDETG